jgi:hypothetical protein
VSILGVHIGVHILGSILLVHIVGPHKMGAVRRSKMGSIKGVQNVAGAARRSKMEVLIGDPYGGSIWGVHIGGPYWRSILGVQNGGGAEVKNGGP